MRAEIVTIRPQPANERAPRGVAIEITCEEERSGDRVTLQHVPDHLASIGILVTREYKIERMLLQIVPDKSAAIVDAAVLSYERDREKAENDENVRAQPVKSPGG